MKYLIIYASAGAGHKKAAEAVYEALLEKIDKKDVRVIDSLDYTNRFFIWIYARKYISLVNRFPNVWGFFYYLFNIKVIYKLIWLPRRLTNALNCRRFEDFVCQNKPDTVISTHFMANEIISRLKRRGRLNCRLFTAVTDYRLHSFWIAPGVDYYFAAAPETKKDLLNSGVKADKIFVTGVPISPKFSVKLDKQKIQVKLGLNIGKFTALIIGGGFGVGPVEELVRKMGALKKDLQLLVVCGYNEPLRRKVNILVSLLNIKAQVYGFVDNIYELMSASDILVTKSGGLTSSEAMAKGLPTIFVRPIPGQEKRNSKVLESAKAAIIARDVEYAGSKIIELFENRDILSRMSAAVKNIAKPDSARDIADIICTQT